MSHYKIVIIQPFVSRSPGSVSAIKNWVQIFHATYQWLKSDLGLDFFHWTGAGINSLNESCKTSLMLFFELTLRKKSPYSELFWSAFFPYFPAFGLNNSEYGLFLRSVMQANNGCSPLLYIHQEKCLKQGANMEICTKITNSQYS